MFANIPSLLIVLPPALLITLACSSKKSRKNAFTVLFSEDIVLDNIELNTAKHIFCTFGNMSVLMGIIGVIVGAIAMASTITAENFESVFGSAFAVCLLPIFYASLSKALCYAAETKIQFKIISQANNPD